MNTRAAHRCAGLPVEPEVPAVQLQHYVIIRAEGLDWHTEQQAEEDCARDSLQNIGKVPEPARFSVGVTRCCRTKLAVSGVVLRQGHAAGGGSGTFQQNSTRLALMEKWVLFFPSASLYDSLLNEPWTRSLDPFFR